MASRESQAKQLIQSIPSYALQETLGGYLQSVQFAASDIFREMGIKKDEKLLNKFLFCAVVRRLWSIIHVQNWLLRNSMNVSVNDEMQGYAIGARNYSLGSNDYRAVTKFYDDFSSFLDELGIGEIIKAPTLSDVLFSLNNHVV